MSLACYKDYSIEIAFPCAGVASSIGTMTWVVTGGTLVLGSWGGSMTGGNGVGFVQCDTPGFDDMGITNAYFTSHFCNGTAAPVTLTAIVNFVSSGGVYVDPPPGHFYNYNIFARLDGVLVDNDPGSIFPVDTSPSSVSWTIAAQTTSEVQLGMALQCSPAPMARVDFTIGLT